ncbi:hypothetical protein RvY_15560 [Ramazzottius varieornatus]|uniref:Uncharacterized protein n=1 Tax=Ramazzottius varieornatus TaxID=947166 RepID=A0A1D1VYK0_RAMVA|nr:hypothetical protein RvY_15560 [Ramazzottius varieornatus]
MANTAQVHVEFGDADSLDIASRLKVANDDEDVKDNWDDESEDEDEKAKVAEAAPADKTTQPAKAKKKSAKEMAAEKEAQKKQEQEALRRQAEAAANMTPEEAAAEKRRIQKEQEDADFALGADTFLDPEDVTAGAGKGVIDSFEPYSLETFNKFRTLLTEKIAKYHKSEFYGTFLNSFFQDLSLYLPAEDVRRIGATLTTLAAEKAKIEKEKAGKGKSKTVKKPGIGAKKLDDSKANMEADYDPMDDMF